MRSVARIVGLSVVVVALAVTGVAIAQQEDPEDFTPRGFEFCGWRDLQDGGWTYDDPGPGAFTRAFAREMTCRSARRNVDRMRYSSRPPYRPFRPGYRCAVVDSAYEYSDIRCTKKGTKRVSFRFQSGA